MTWCRRTSATGIALALLVAFGLAGVAGQAAAAEVTQIQVKLMGVLKKRTPPRGVLELEDGTTLAQAFSTLELPTSRIHAVSLNGQVERDFSRTLKPGDELIVLPPVGGGSAHEPGHILEPDFQGFPGANPIFAYRYIHQYHYLCLKYI